MTGLFVEGKDVYLEYEHRDVVRVGDTGGKVDSERPVLPGQPTRDGRYLVSVLLKPVRRDQVVVNSYARPSLKLRFAQAVSVGAPVEAVVALDTDRNGVIYLGLWVRRSVERSTRGEIAGKLVCLSQEDGRVLGSADLPVSNMPEETFRTMSALDTGGVLWSTLSKEGPSYQVYRCQ